MRGRSGGYRLGRPATEIGLGSVLMILGEPLFDEPGYCQRHPGTETDGQCVHLNGCTLKSLWQTLEDWMRHVLDQITLSDLLQNQHSIAELVRTRLAHEFIEQPTMRPLMMAKE